MALIYGELDLSFEGMSLDFLETFILETEETHRALGHSKEEDVYFQRNNRRYPWNRRILQFRNKKFYNYDSRSEFQNLSKVLDQLPIRKEERIVLLLQQTYQPDYDFSFHFDNDCPYGFRICIGLDTSKIFLEQSKIKEEYKAHALELKKIENSMVEEKIYQIKPIKSNTVFMVNGESYPHRVPVSNNLQRAVFVVRGQLESTDHLKFLQKEEA